MTFDVDEFLDSYELPSVEVPIFPNDELRERHAHIEAKLVEEAGGGLVGPPPELLAELEAVEAEIEATVKIFKLRAVPYAAWADLMAAHPPSKAQSDDGHATNPDTFEPVALEACAESPKVSASQAKRMRDRLSPAEWQRLMQAIRHLHVEPAHSPKSFVLSVTRRLNGASSATQPAGASLADPSSGDDDGQ